MWPVIAGRDTALLWDERHGSALAVETRSGEDLLVLPCLGVELGPAPARVRGFVAAVRAGASGRPGPPDLRGDRADLLERLRSHRRVGPVVVSRRGLP